MSLPYLLMVCTALFSITVTIMETMRKARNEIYFAKISELLFDERRKKHTNANPQLPKLMSRDPFRKKATTQARMETPAAAIAIA